jgi:hypothetical protein
LQELRVRAQREQVRKRTREQVFQVRTAPTQVVEGSQFAEVSVTGGVAGQEDQAEGGIPGIGQFQPQDGPDPLLAALLQEQDAPGHAVHVREGHRGVAQGASAGHQFADGGNAPQEAVRAVDVERSQGHGFNLLDSAQKSN